MTPEELDKLHKTGMADDDRRVGRFGLPSEPLLVPADVWVEGDFIRWSMEDRGTGVFGDIRPVKPSLVAFGRLGRATDPAPVLAFAQTWGVLGLCDLHGQPASHDRSCLEDLQTAGEGREALDDWRRYANGIRSALLIVGALRGDSLPDQAEWTSALAGVEESIESVGGSHGEFPPPILQALPPDVRVAVQIGQEKRRLVWLLDRLVAMSAIRPRVWWPELLDKAGLAKTGVGPELVLTSEWPCETFAAIVTQLMAATCAGQGWSQCLECGEIFVPTRRPRQDDRTFCQKCRDAKAPQRAAARDYRARKKRTAGNGRPGDTNERSQEDEQASKE